MSQSKRSAQRKTRGAKRPLYFTFGNHMHWVDMQWLWGYHVLPGSVRDMLHLIKETGAKGNVNFDGIGYEKMAAECPEALADLRAAVRRGDVEPVGCSYGQPYGLFHAGESNVRQFTHGVRSVIRLLGARPRSFWEEEFYFFPQLPQILKQCGFTGASLFFQWTWHTPEIPKEPHSLIMWEGVDGTQLPTLPRNDLNLHQWPEDFDGLLDRVSQLPDSETAAIVQWLELMPSKDWMCRSEVLLPRLKELMRDKRFEVRPRTVATLITDLQKEARRERIAVPVRAYSMDDVWHGMTLGKNADRHPRTCAKVETDLIEAEAISATLSLFGRPYPSWDVYPTWELDEAWRNLLAAQHHDNHECEGLCGFAAYNQLDTARRMSSEVYTRAHQMLNDRVGDAALICPFGFERTDPFFAWPKGPVRKARVPAFGYSVGTPHRLASKGRSRKTKSSARLTRDGTSVSVDLSRGVITQITTPDFPDGVLADGFPLGQLARMVAGRKRGLPRVDKARVSANLVSIDFKSDNDSPFLQLGFTICIAPDASGVELEIRKVGELERPDPGYAGAIRMPIVPRWPVQRLRADSPYAVSAVEGGPPAKRKYPRGDWMTSPQWFEEVSGGITACRFLDMQGPNNAHLLILHDASQQYFRTENGVDAILCAYDPWDEHRYAPAYDMNFKIVPHRGMSDARRTQLSAQFLRHDDRYGLEQIPRNPRAARFDYPIPSDHLAPSPAPDLPPTFGPLEILNAPNVLAHAFFRESMKSGEHLPTWAGHRMFKDSRGACDNPFVIRLVEWNGEPARVRLKLAGDVALAAKTNLLGEVDRWLKVKHPVDPPWWGKHRRKVVKFRGKPITWSQIEFDMRPREIATIYADMVMGRKEFRDLDAKRKVWATVHKK